MGVTSIVWWKFEREQAYQVPEYGDTWHASNLKCNQTAFLSDVLPDTECNYVTEFDDVRDDGAIVVLSGGHALQPHHRPAGWHGDYIRKLNGEIARLRWVVVVAAYDSESYFPLRLLNHPNMRIWVQEPKPGAVGPPGPAPLGEVHNGANRRLPVMYSRSAAAFLPDFKDEMRKKPLDWFFAGRLVDESRQAWSDAMRGLPPQHSALYDAARDADNKLSSCVPTREYIKGFASAKVVPCRPAPCTPETARIYDALEAGCVPIVPNYPANEGWAIRYKWSQYWQQMFGGQPPFPTIDSPRQLAGAVRDTLADWPTVSAKVGTWWKGYKARLALELKSEVEHLRSEEHTSELQSRQYLVCRLLLEKKKTKNSTTRRISKHEDSRRDPLTNNHN